MEQIELDYDFKLQDDNKVNNVALYDQKDIFDSADEIVIKGVLYIDLMFENGNIQHEKRDFQIRLNRCKYHKKDLSLKIDDYSYVQEEKNLKLKMIFVAEGEDVSLEKFCLLDNTSLENELRDYLNREKKPLDQLTIPEDKIILLDPVIEEELLPLEVPIEELRTELDIEENQEIKPEEIINEQPKETIKIESCETKKKENLFNEKYSTSYIFYRVRKDDNLDVIAKKFSISKESILLHNPQKEIKENILIQIPKHV